LRLLRRGALEYMVHLDNPPCVREALGLAGLARWRRSPKSLRSLRRRSLLLHSPSLFLLTSPLKSPILPSGTPDSRGLILLHSCERTEHAYPTLTGSGSNPQFFLTFSRSVDVRWGFHESICSLPSTDSCFIFLHGPICLSNAALRWLGPHRFRHIIPRTTLLIRTTAPGPCFPHPTVCLFQVTLR
jgi:hypothetical protein